jgi:hypothetical protein
MKSTLSKQSSNAYEKYSNEYQQPIYSSTNKGTVSASSADTNTMLSSSTLTRQSSKILAELNELKSLKNRKDQYQNRIQFLESKRAETLAQLDMLAKQSQSTTTTTTSTNVSTNVPIDTIKRQERYTNANGLKPLPSTIPNCRDLNKYAAITASISQQSQQQQQNGQSTSPLTECINVEIPSLTGIQSGKLKQSSPASVTSVASSKASQSRQSSAKILTSGSVMHTNMPNTSSPKGVTGLTSTPISIPPSTTTTTTTTFMPMLSASMAMQMPQPQAVVSQQQSIAQQTTPIHNYLQRSGIKTSFSNFGTQTGKKFLYDDSITMILTNFKI